MYNNIVILLTIKGMSDLLLNFSCVYIFLPLSGDPVAAIGLMSPVHRSSSNMDTTALGLMEDEEGVNRERGEDTDTSGDIERSSSMPPPQFPPDDQRRSRVQAGVCIQRQQNIRRHSHDPSHDSYPTRRNAIRGGRAGHRAMSMDEGAHHRTTAVGTSGSGPAGGERGRAFSASVAEGATSSGGASAVTGGGGVGQLTIKEEDPVIEKVRMKLFEDDHVALAEVVDRMPAGVHDAILHNTINPQCIETLTSRIAELKRGRLATGDADSGPGTLHWFEGQ